MSSRDPIGHAVVGSYGLAHSLLAWARCRLWCNDHGYRMLASSWLHIRHRIGPMLRGERDKRRYHELFSFPGYMRGLDKLIVLARYRVVEAVDLASPAMTLEPGTLVGFRNLLADNEENHFAEIRGRGAEVRSALMNITRARYQPEIVARPHVALRVRLGDFRAIESNAVLERGAKNARLPLAWYVDVLEALRARLGPIPVRLYSDGEDDDLAPLLLMADVTRSPKQASVTDLLAMSQATALVSSGSGFSMWGSYLGGVPRLCFPGQRFVRTLCQDGATDLEPEVACGSEIPEDFSRLLMQRLEGSAAGSDSESLANRSS